MKSLCWYGAAAVSSFKSCRLSEADNCDPASVGLYTVQLAALLGFHVVTTCSPRHHAHVKSLGAKHVFDYRDPDVVAKIKQSAPGLRYVFDTIGDETSSPAASSAITSDQGVICTVRPGKQHTEGVAKGVRITSVLVWTAFLKEHRYGDFVWPVSYTKSSQLSPC